MYKKKRYIIVGVVALALVAVLLIYLVFDPTSSGWFPQCMIKSATGYSCPGCGTQRALHSILNGNFREGIHYNYSLLVTVPVLLLVAFERVLMPGSKAALMIRKGIENWVTMALLFAFTISWFVLRNVFDL